MFIRNAEIDQMTWKLFGMCSECSIDDISMLHQIGTLPTGQSMIGKLGTTWSRKIKERKGRNEYNLKLIQTDLNDENSSVPASPVEFSLQRDVHDVGISPNSADNIKYASLCSIDNAQGPYGRYGHTKKLSAAGMLCGVSDFQCEYSHFQ